LLKLPKNAPQPVLIVTCGWEYPMSAALQPFSTNDELDDFDLVRVHSYLQSQGIIPSIISAQDALVRAFYDFSRGHPLVLALAVTYFQALLEQERTVENMQAKRTLLDEEARIQWLEERLLKRLPEPYRMLLERGPILRSLNQATLQVLLQAERDGNNAEVVLDDRSYIRFLQYPFINRKNASGTALLEQPVFHDLTRRVRLEALRRWHPKTRQRLHHAMADYYRKIIEAEQQRASISQTQQPEKDFAEWFAEIPEQEFRASLEYLYHALHITEIQTEVFDRWKCVVNQAVLRWRRKQAGPLLEIVRQVAEEGEPFLNKYSTFYGQYLLWYSQFLEQVAQWDDVLVILQEAMQIFEQGQNPSDQATCLNNIGVIYHTRGLLDLALDYHQRALSLREQIDNPSDIAHSLNNIGAVYGSRGQLDLALDYQQRALSLFEQVGNPSDIALSLHNIGFIYRRQKQFDLALNYYQRSLSLFEQVGDPVAIARSLNNIGTIFDKRGQLDLALNYYQHSLSLREQIGNPSDIARSLNNTGFIYQRQGRLDTALNYYQRALPLYEQVGNPSDIAISLNNIGTIFEQQNQWQNALPLFSRSLNLYEQMGKGFESDIADELNMLAVCYVKLGEIDKGVLYHTCAQKIREQLEGK
jgi:tetratricopeptide (TPR) repeat protein